MKLAWLILRNDLRLGWRDLRGHKLRTSLLLLGGTALLVLGHGAVIALCVGRAAPPPLVVEATIWAFAATFMLGIAMQQSLAVLFVRTDLDLLLSAPVPPRVLLLARMSSIIVSALAGVGLFLLPLINGPLVVFGFHYTAAYGTGLMLAAIAASAGLAATLLLVRWFGVRRGRILVQVGGAVFGASAYLATQAPVLLPPAASRRIGEFLARVAESPVFLLPAEAGRGELGSFTLLLGVAIGATGAVSLGLGRWLVRGAQATAPARRRRAGRLRPWRGGPFSVAVRKDVRLMLRDPLLLAQILPSAIYLLPAAMAGWRMFGATVPALMAVAIAGQFASMLTRVTADGEECWDLIRGSPASERRQRLAKMVAGSLLPASLATLFCAFAVWQGAYRAGGVAWITALLVALGSARVQVATIQPTARRDVFKRRRGGSLLALFVNLGLMLVGSTTVVVAARGPWWGAVAGVGLTAAGVAMCFAVVNFKETRFDHAQP